MVLLALGCLSRWRSVWPGPIARNHGYLNQMALKLDTTSIRQGQQLADEFKHGQWQPIPEKSLAPAKSPASEVVLKLNGVTSGSPAFASINGRTLAVGESTKVTLTSGTVNLKCLKIEPKAVLIQKKATPTPVDNSLKVQPPAFWTAVA